MKAGRRVKEQKKKEGSRKETEKEGRAGGREECENHQSSHREASAGPRL